MRTRPSLWLSLTAAVAVVSILIAVAVASMVSARGPGAPTPVSSATFYWGTGPAAIYFGGDVGSIGIVAPRRFTVPAASSATTSYEALVTVGLQYRTRGNAPFVVEVLLRRGGAGRRVATKPDRLLLAATVGDSTTATFRVTGLEPGVTYEVAPMVNASSGTRNAIRTKFVVMDVALTPR